MIEILCWNELIEIDLNQHLEETFVKYSISPQVKRIIMGCLETDPKKRFDSMNVVGLLRTLHDNYE